VEFLRVLFSGVKVVKTAKDRAQKRGRRGKYGKKKERHHFQLENPYQKRGKKLPGG